MASGGSTRPRRSPSSSGCSATVRRRAPCCRSTGAASSTDLPPGVDRDFFGAVAPTPATNGPTRAPVDATAASASVVDLAGRAARRPAPPGAGPPRRAGPPRARRRASRRARRPRAAEGGRARFADGGRAAQRADPLARPRRCRRRCCSTIPTLDALAAFVIGESRPRRPAPAARDAGRAVDDRGRGRVHADLLELTTRRPRRCCSPSSASSRGRRERGRASCRR